MPSDRTPRPARPMICGTIPCAGISAGDPKGSLCLHQVPTVWTCGMSSMFRIQAHGGIPGMWSHGRCLTGPRSLSLGCSRNSTTQTRAWGWNSRSGRSHSSRHWSTGEAIPGTSATAWTAPRLRSMMISASEPPSGKPRWQASPTASKPAAASIRNWTGKPSMKSWTGTPHRQ